MVIFHVIESSYFMRKYVYVCISVCWRNAPYFYTTRFNVSFYISFAFAITILLTLQFKIRNEKHVNGNAGIINTFEYLDGIVLESICQ